MLCVKAVLVQMDRHRCLCHHLLDTGKVQGNATGDYHIAMGFQGCLHFLQATKVKQYTHIE